MDERQVTRFVADAHVRCEVDGTTHRLSLHNLSIQGCMVDSPPRLDLAGRRIVIELVRGVSAAARVTWQRGQFMGVRFATELPIAVVELLAFKISNPGGEFQPPHHRFGGDFGTLPRRAEVVQAWVELNQGPLPLKSGGR